VETPDEWIFTPRPSPPDTIELTELHERLEELVIVDARLPSRWRGEPNAVDRIPGRIPGALNAPWTEELPMLPDGETVVYCGSGVTACAALFRMEAAGRPARLYVGSWSEWEQHPELPIERS
jgi:thiosulfate/3-mercaptopyruvate sulfurtransferase